MRSKRPAPPLVEADDGDRVATAMAKQRERTRKALSGTKFTAIEAAVVQWLMGGDDDELREQTGRVFGHRLSKASAKTLGGVRNLLRLLVEAVADNDGDALNQAAGLVDLFLGLEDQNGRVVRALSLVEHGAKALATQGTTVCAMLPFYLTVADGRFGGLTPAQVRGVLSRVKLDRNTDGNVKGGRTRIGVPMALGELAAFVGAFDVSKPEQILEKIKTAKRAKNKPIRRRRK